MQPDPTHSAPGKQPAHVEARSLHRDHATGDSVVRDWEALRASSEFRELMAAKYRFIIPATVFFLAFYLLLPLGDAFAPELMKTNVFGHINIAYLFALCQFLMTWTVTYLYIHRAETVFDKLAANVRRMAGQVEA